MTTLLIPVHNLPALAVKIGKLNERADKLGVEGVAFTLGDTVPHPQNKTVPAIPVTFTVPVFKLAGWKLAARLEHMESGNIMYTAPYIDALPERYRTAKPYCDHCQTLRARKDTFICLSDTGEFMQVGSSCIKDFLGHDASRVAAWLSFICDIEEEFTEERESWGHTESTTYLLDYLAYVAYAVENYGYVSNANADFDNGKLSTAVEASCIMNDKRFNHDLVTVDHYATARAAIEYTKSLDGVSDFTYNLVTIANLNTISFKQRGFAAYIIGGYIHHLKKQAEIEANRLNNTSQYLGEVKDKVTIDAQVTFTRFVHSKFGTTQLVKASQGGNLIVWFNSSSVEYKQGDTLKGTATVKALEEFNGEKQTTITRFKAA